MNVPAVLQTAVVAIGLLRTDRYAAFLLSLCASLPFLWVTPAIVGNGAIWERRVWLPCAVILIPLQALAAIEAFYDFGRRYRLAPSASIAVSFFALAAVLGFVVWPFGDAVGQVVQAARYQRVWTCVFLLLGCGWYASIAARDLLMCAEGRHLLLVAAWSVTWMIPIIRPVPPTWAEWLAADWMVIARCVVLGLWVAAVALGDLMMQVQGLILGETKGVQ